MAYKFGLNVVGSQTHTIVREQKPLLVDCPHLVFGDGCFLRWGKNCWTDWRIPFRNDRTFMDISIFGKGLDIEPVAEPSKPAFTNKSAWSTDFAARFGFDDIKASIEQWEVE